MAGFVQPDKIWVNLPRPDVGAVLPAAGPNHGYNNLMMATTPGLHTVRLYGINTGPGVSTKLGCRVVTVASSNPFGTIDAVATGPQTVTAAGWAIDPDTSAHIIVQTYIDGRVDTLTGANTSGRTSGRCTPCTGSTMAIT
jgi:hypothetical protein